MLPIVKMRMFDIHKDIWSFGFSFILLIIHIHFNIAYSTNISKLNRNKLMLKMSTGSKNNDLYSIEYQ